MARAILLVLISFVSHQVVLTEVWTSPCPKYFQYETRREQDKWYGKLVLKTDTNLIDGVWLILVFDKPVIQLGTQFGQKIIRLKPNEFIVQNLGYTLYADISIDVRFFVKYDKQTAPPKLQEFRLNARTVCPEQAPPTTTEGQFITSDPLDVGLSDKINSIFGSNDKKPGQVLQTMNTVFVQRPILEFPDVPCGKIAEQPVGLIAFGENTLPGQWPWHVAIYNYIDAQMRYTCGGSLISKKHVLTAAHCATEPRTTNPLKLDIITLYLGKHDLRKFGSEVQEREVSKITIHPKFTHNMLNNDIAILTMSNPVKYTEYVRPICIWTDYTPIDIVHDRLGTVVGWGFDEKQQLSNLLKQVEMPVVTHGDCILSNSEFFSKVVNDNNYCAGFRNGTSACNGDSGGGMFFTKSLTGGLNTIWHIRGLVSIGVALQGQYICDNKQYVVFTDVAKYLKWIDSVIKE